MILSCLPLLVLFFSTAGSNSSYIAGASNSYNSLVVSALTTTDLSESTKQLIDIEKYHKASVMDDFVVLQRIASSYLEMSKRFISNGMDDIAEKILESTVDYFRRGEVAFERRQQEATVDVIAKAIEVNTNGDYPQESFKQSRPNILRQWGDVTSPEDMYVFSDSYDIPFINITDLERAISDAISDGLKEEISSGLKSRGISSADGWVQLQNGLTKNSDDWHQLPLVVDGVLKTKHCLAMPKLCKLLTTFTRRAGSLSKVGQVKLSAMRGTVVNTHAGPTNNRLRMHCTISNPFDRKRSFMTVGTEKVHWEEEASCIVFDESCQHNVRIVHKDDEDTDTLRIILIWDLPNPFLWPFERFLDAVGGEIGDRHSLDSALREEYLRFHKVINAKKNATLS